jgi:hypothetical protein
MNRRTFMGVAGAMFALPDTSPVSIDTDRHELSTETRDGSWLATRLRRTLPMDDVDWVQLDDEYTLPASEGEARTYANVLNALVETPYRRDHYDCEDVSMQLMNLFARAGMNAGVAITDSHAYCVLVAADGTLRKWEPQVATDVTGRNDDRYTFDDGAGTLLL